MARSKLTKAERRRYDALVTQCSLARPGRRRRTRAQCEEIVANALDGVNDAQPRRAPRRAQSYTTLARQDARKSRGASCPSTFTIEVRERLLGNVTAEAYDASGKLLGHVVAEPGERGSYNVVGAAVEEPGCGIGTRLYEALARYAAADGRVLASDTKLSPYSFGFWSKQQRKGRARWDENEQRFRLNDDVTRSSSIDLSGRKR